MRFFFKLLGETYLPCLMLCSHEWTNGLEDDLIGGLQSCVSQRFVAVVGCAEPRTTTNNTK